MTDQTAEEARVMAVAEAVIIELQRQGVLDVVGAEGFDPIAMAKVVIKAAAENRTPTPQTR